MASTDTTTDTTADITPADKLYELQALIGMLAPMIAADGGELVLLSVDVETGVVEVQLRGACASCAISMSTLQGGVTRILTERLDWVREVRGSLDEDIDFYDSMSRGTGAYVPRTPSD
jgi:Fe-S cluster biogenesis protein NfuA